MMSFTHWDGWICEVMALQILISSSHHRSVARIERGLALVSSRRRALLLHLVLGRRGALRWRRLLRDLAVGGRVGGHRSLLLLLGIAHGLLLLGIPHGLLLLRVRLLLVGLLRDVARLLGVLMLLGRWLVALLRLSRWLLRLLLVRGALG